MLALFLTVAVEFSVTWREPTFAVRWVEPVKVEPAKPDPAAIERQLNREQRAAVYDAARALAERSGRAVYISDGRPGCPLPTGHYELLRGTDGEVLYRTLEPVKLKIKIKERTNIDLMPQPDPAMRFQRTEEQCLT